MGEILGEAMAQILDASELYPGDVSSLQHLYNHSEVTQIGNEQYRVHDLYQQILTYLFLCEVLQSNFAPR